MAEHNYNEINVLSILKLFYYLSIWVAFGASKYRTVYRKPLKSQMNNSQVGSFASFCFGNKNVDLPGRSLKCPLVI